MLFDKEKAVELLERYYNIFAKTVKKFLKIFV